MSHHHDPAREEAAQAASDRADYARDHDALGNRRRDDRTPPDAAHAAELAADERTAQDLAAWQTRMSLHNTDVLEGVVEACIGIIEKHGSIQLMRATCEAIHRSPEPATTYQIPEVADVARLQRAKKLLHMEVKLEVKAQATPPTVVCHSDHSETNTQAPAAPNPKIRRRKARQ